MFLTLVRLVVRTDFTANYSQLLTLVTYHRHAFNLAFQYLTGITKAFPSSDPLWIDQPAQCKPGTDFLFPVGYPIEGPRSSDSLSPNLTGSFLTDQDYLFLDVTRPSAVNLLLLIPLVGKHSHPMKLLS